MKRLNSALKLSASLFFSCMATFLLDGFIYGFSGIECIPANSPQRALFEFVFVISFVVACILYLGKKYNTK
jgi:hypothetical protein